MAIGPLAEAAVEIVADGDRFPQQLEDELRRGVRSASGDIEREFERAGQRSGRRFADGVTRDAQGRLRNAQGRFVKAGEDAGSSFGAGMQRTAGRGASRAGEDAGNFFSRSFETAASRAVGQNLLRVFSVGAGGLVTAISPLGTLLGGATAAVVALAAGLTQAAGAGLALGGVLASAGLAAATLAVGTSGLSDALGAQGKALQELNAEGAVSAATQKKLDEAMKGLAPSAQAVVRALGAQSAAWSTLRTTVQQGLFVDLSGEVSRLAGTYLPLLRTQLADAAGTLNGFAREFAQFLTSGDRAQRINDVLTALNNILATLLPTAVPLANAFLTLFQASLPFAQQLATAIAGVGASFASWAAGIVASGQFATFMQGAMAAASSLLGILGNVGSILATVFGAGSAAGGGLLQLLDDLTGRLAQFLQSAQGQQALGSFFGLIASAGSVLLDIVASLQPAIAGLAAVFQALQVPIQSLGAALGPIIAQLFVTLGAALQQIAPLLAQLVVGLTPLVAVLGQGLVTVLQAVLAAVLPVMPVLVQLATLFAAQLVPIVVQLVPVLVQLAGTFGQLLAGAAPLLAALVPIVPALTQLSLSMVQLLAAAAPLVAVLAQVAGLLAGALAAGVTLVMPLVLGLIGGLTSLITTSARVVAAVASFVGQIVANFQNLRAQGVGIFQSLAGAVGAAVGGLVGQVVGLLRSLVTQGLGVLRGWVGSAREVAGSVASSILGAIRSGLSGLAAVFRAPFDSARSAVSSALQSILSTVTGFIDRIQGAVSRISGAIASIPRPNFPGINIPGLANGAIVNRPTLHVFGEAGAEAAIPLTRPRRALDLMRESGLLDLALSSQAAGGKPGKTKEIHMPIYAQGTSAEAVVELIESKMGERFGRTIGIDTSVGAM